MKLEPSSDNEQVTTYFDVSNLSKINYTRRVIVIANAAILELTCEKKWLPSCCMLLYFEFHFKCLLLEIYLYLCKSWWEAMCSFDGRTLGRYFFCYTRYLPDAEEES